MMTISLVIFIGSRSADWQRAKYTQIQEPLTHRTKTQATIDH